MKIYTKTGDAGDTGLFGGARVSKGSSRVDAYGDVDELNSVIGVALSDQGADASSRENLTRIQHQLFALGAELACVPGKEDKLGIAVLTSEDVSWLESCIDRCETDLAPLKNFVLPGGSTQASFLHVARTVCRRAERKVVSLHEAQPVRPELVRFLNRLSDLLFVMARHANFRANVPDVEWRARTSRDDA